MFLKNLIGWFLQLVLCTNAQSNGISGFERSVISAAPMTIVNLGIGEILEQAYSTSNKSRIVVRESL